MIGNSLAILILPALAGPRPAARKFPKAGARRMQGNNTLRTDTLFTPAPCLKGAAVSIYLQS